MTTTASDEPGFTVNLEDTKSKGGGKSWLAASASAAVVGTLFTGTNPSNIDIGFDITGPIDGPSAGGILTVGVLASINGDSLKPNITMTGTISPEGSIGPVGGVGLKMDAAKKNGYTTVVLPASITIVTDTETEESVSTVSYGKKLGLTVEFVTTVAQAYKIFTGEDLFSPPGENSSLTTTAEQEKVYAEVATDIVAEGAELLTQVYVKPDSNLTKLINAANTALAEEDYSLAYGLGAKLLTRTARLQGQQISDAVVENSGFTQAQTDLLAVIEQAKVEAEAARKEKLAHVGKLQTSQLFALPLALTGETFAQAVFESMALKVAELDPESPFSVDELHVASGVVAEEVSNVTDIMKYEDRIVAALPSTSAQFEIAPAEFLSGYTDFLVASGNANTTYLEDVFGASLQDIEDGDISSIMLTLSGLQAAAAAISQEIQPAETELSQYSTALTYFVVSSAAVSAYQTLGLTAVNFVSVETGEEDAYLSDAVEGGQELTTTFAAGVQQAGLEPGFTTWSADWARATFDILQQNKHESEGATFALNQIWYDVVGVLTMYSYIASVGLVATK